MSNAAGPDWKARNFVRRRYFIGELTLPSDRVLHDYPA
jgi:hypothetical protein